MKSQRRPGEWADFSRRHPLQPHIRSSAPVAPAGFFISATPKKASLPQRPPHQTGHAVAGLITALPAAPVCLVRKGGTGTAGRRFFLTGCWLLIAGRWLLIAGLRLLAAVCPCFFVFLPVRCHIPNSLQRFSYPYFMQKNSVRTPKTAPHLLSCGAV